MGDALMFLSLILFASSDNGSSLFLFFGPAAGVVFYFLSYERYRNAGKTYQYERKTKVRMKNIQQKDELINHINGTRREYVPQDNISDFRLRVKRLTKDEQFPKGADNSSKDR